MAHAHSRREHSFHKTTPQTVPPVTTGHVHSVSTEDGPRPGSSTACELQASSRLRGHRAVVLEDRHVLIFRSVCRFFRRRFGFGRDLGFGGRLTPALALSLLLLPLRRGLPRGDGDVFAEEA